MIRSKDLIYDFILRRDNIYLQTQYFWPILNSRNSNFRLFKEKFDHNVVYNRLFIIAHDMQAGDL